MIQPPNFCHGGTVGPWDNRSGTVGAGSLFKRSGRSNYYSGQLAPLSSHVKSQLVDTLCGSLPKPTCYPTPSRFGLIYAWSSRKSEGRIDNAVILPFDRNIFDPCYCILPARIWYLDFPPTQVQRPQTLAGSSAKHHRWT